MSYDMPTEVEVKAEVTPAPKAVGPIFAMPRNERIEITNKLRALSLEIFGKSGKWRKLLDNGMPEAVMNTVVETVPGENGAPDTTKEVKVPKMVNGVKEVYIRRFTLESLLSYLLEVKEKRDEIMAKIKALQDEQNAKLAAEKARREALDEAKGSAL